MTTVYALCEPETGEIRYVGKTVWPIQRRARHHVNEAAAAARHTHRYHWLRSLSSPPMVRALVVVPDLFASEMEQLTIMHLKQKGYRLVNGTDGGEGAPGRRHTDEAKAKISRAHLGRKHSEETRKKLSAMRLGKKLKVTALRFRKRPRSAEWQANLTKALPRGPLSPEHRAKISAGGKGRVFTPEHRARAIAGIRAAYARRRELKEKELIHG